MLIPEDAAFLVGEPPLIGLVGTSSTIEVMTAQIVKDVQSWRSSLCGLPSRSRVMTGFA